MVTAMSGGRIRDEMSVRPLTVNPTEGGETGK